MLTAANSLRPDSSRMSARNETVKSVLTSNDYSELSNGVAVRNTPDKMKPFMTQSLKISFIVHSFVRALLWCKDIMSFRIFRVTMLVFGCFSLGSTERYPPRRLTVGQLLYLSDCRGNGRAMQKDAKANFWFRDIVLKQWTFLGFLRHTSVNAVYK